MLFVCWIDVMWQNNIKYIGTHEVSIFAILTLHPNTVSDVSLICFVGDFAKEKFRLFFTNFIHPAHHVCTSSMVCQVTWFTHIYVIASQRITSRVMYNCGTVEWFAYTDKQLLKCRRVEYCWPASWWRRDNAFVSGARGLKLKSQANEIGHSVANGSPVATATFLRKELWCLLTQWRGDGSCKLVTRVGLIQRVH